jgi:hypothetical protein
VVWLSERSLSSSCCRIFFRYIIIAEVLGVGKQAGNLSAWWPVLLQAVAVNSPFIPLDEEIWKHFLTAFGLASNSSNLLGTSCCRLPDALGSSLSLPASLRACIHLCPCLRCTHALACIVTVQLRSLSRGGGGKQCRAAGKLEAGFEPGAGSGAPVHRMAVLQRHRQAGHHALGLVGSCQPSQAE